jgi:hypothetical protein
MILRVFRIKLESSAVRQTHWRVSIFLTLSPLDRRFPSKKVHEIAARVDGTLLALRDAIAKAARLRRRKKL